MTTTRFVVPAMDCAAEKELITHRLRRADWANAIEHLEFDLLDRIVTVRHRAGMEGSIEAALVDIGMKPERLPPEGTPQPPSGIQRPSLAEATGWARGTWLLIGSGIAALAAEVVAWTTGREQSWPVMALAALAIMLGGPATFRKGLVAMRTLTLNINLLMLIAVVGALAIGQWPEAAMVTFLFALAELIEAKSVDRARNAIRSLMALAPEMARVHDGRAWVETAAEGVARGTVVQVLPGERVPLDGKLVRGETAIDQAPITGESVPVDKAIGDAVFAGTINTYATFELEVTVAQADSTLARIGRTIRAAQSQKAPSERFVDGFARVYTPIVVLLAVLTAIVVPLVTRSAFDPWIYKALVLLVIACPCALVISTPVTVVSGLAAAARLGLLVKGGSYLEGARQLKVIALDKTGTLTRGRPSLTDAVPLRGATPDDLLQRAASLEATSTHPVAQAVARGWGGAMLPVGASHSIVGRGMEGVVAGRPLIVGSHRLAEERGVCGADIEAELARLEAEGKSVMVVWSGSDTLGVLAVADTMRATSIEAIAQLHRQGIKVAMLTGDNPTTAAGIARLVGIDEVAAHLLPEDKLTAVDRLRAVYGPVGMVGDGVNDAPALARATIGFAMGAAGTDTALETADVALMQDDLRGVPTLIELSRRTNATLKTNIAIAIGIKAVFFILALVGVATLWMAVFADMGASLLVAGNGLRLLRTGTPDAGPKVPGPESATCAETGCKPRAETGCKHCH